MEMIVFVGCQGAGKTTFFLQRFFPTHLRINLDQLRTRHREKLLLEACIAMKQRCVVDNTNPLVADRRRYLDAAARGRFTPIAYYFETAVDDALRRNAGRLAAARVPDVALRGTARKLQVPTLAEGFAEVRVVRARDDGGFDDLGALDEVR
jgi:predicted kinase